MRFGNIIFAGMLAGATWAAAAGARRPNVLFIAVDDLKPMLGCYGHSEIRSPNLDRLAARGMVFLNAYCQQAVCGPTRASLLTGRRPDYTRVWDLKTKMRDIHPDILTLPQHFKNHGYETVGLGKIFDPRCVDGRQWGDKPSWSRPYVHVPKNPDSEMGFLNPAFVERVRKIRREKRLTGDWGVIRKAIGGVPPVEHSEDVPDNAYEDGALAEAAAGLVKELAAGDRPFFLAVGFHKPHLPFIAPQKYWNLYADDALELAKFQQMPADAPGFAFQDSWELKNGSYAVPRGPGLLPRDLQRELIHGYYACVSYVDAQIGKVLDALEAAGAAGETIVVVWGDHGWHLGDHGMWCKHTNYEQATRAPLIIARRASGPGLGVAKWPVEFVDIFPTLCELAGVPRPRDLAGVSLVPVLDHPSARLKEVAVSQFPRHRKGGEVMGYAFRDERYRYVQWVPRRAPHSGSVVAEELYDYAKDPWETRSLVNDPAYAAPLALMRQRARRFHADSR